MLTAPKLSGGDFGICPGDGVRDIPDGQPHRGQGIGINGDDEFFVQLTENIGFLCAGQGRYDPFKLFGKAAQNIHLRLCG